MDDCQRFLQLASRAWTVTSGQQAGALGNVLSRSSVLPPMLSSLDVTSFYPLVRVG